MRKMSNVSDSDNTGTVMIGADAENEIQDVHGEQAASERLDFRG
jgi:hypothetical protein